MSNKKILLQQDDCAPDSMEYFKKEFYKTTGYTFDFFKAVADFEDLNDSFKYEYLGIVVEWCIEDPYYKVYLK